MILDIFENLDSYSRAFMDPVLWDPFLRLICDKHHFSPVEVIRPGLAGTYPTFIVDESRVIKLFGRLFNGAESWAVERLCAELVQAAQHFPSARLLGWGALFAGENWNWPYLIFEYIPGISLGEAAQNISYTERERLASWLGESVRTLHDIPLNNKALRILPRQKNILGNTRMNPSQRHQSWKKLPANWLDQIEDYLTSTDYL